MADDIRNKMRMQYALKERDARSACHIVEAQRHIFDLIETQSPAVLEALLDYLKSIQRPAPGARPFRMKLKEALLEYVNDALKEQRKLERVLHYGITGETEVDEDEPQK
jgi:hypothetical protein